LITKLVYFHGLLEEIVKKLLKQVCVADKFVSSERNLLSYISIFINF